MNTVCINDFTVGANYCDLLLKALDSTSLYINDEIAYFTGGYMQVTENDKSLMFSVDDDNIITEVFEGKYQDFLIGYRIEAVRKAL